MGALWSIQGVGPKTIAAIEKRHGPLGELLERPLAEWAPAIKWTSTALESLVGLRCLADAADRLEAQVRRFGYAIAYRDDPAYPQLLASVEQAPPLLFHLGPGADAPPRRRLAMVGSRHLQTGLGPRVRAFAREVAARGVGVVSGAAEGIDRLCHLGALDARGETWAFIGCAIEEMDSTQAVLKPLFAEGRATFFSQFPPGARSATYTFPRRNRLISGAADATLVARARHKSGALYTARFALDQRRPLLAMVSDPLDETAAGCHQLVRKGYARACLGLDEVWAALGLDQVSSGAGPRPFEVPAGLSTDAEAVLKTLDRQPVDFDLVAAGAPQLDSGRLAAALLELELCGAIVQKAGRRFERVA